MDSVEKELDDILEHLQLYIEDEDGHLFEQFYDDLTKWKKLWLNERENEADNYLVEQTLQEMEE